MSNVSDENEIIDEHSLYIKFTRNEILYLDDSLTLMIEREMFHPSEGMQLTTMRVVAPTAPLPVPIELIDKIALGVLYTADPDNIGKDAELEFVASELYLLREICQSYVKVGNEQVGYNLKKNIYGALYADEYQTNKLLDSLSKDLELKDAKSIAPHLVGLSEVVYDDGEPEKGGANEP